MTQPAHRRLVTEAAGNATYLTSPADPLDGAFLAYDSTTGQWVPRIGSAAAIVVSDNPDEPLADGQVHFLVEPEWSPLTLDLAWWFDATTIEQADSSTVTVWDDRSGYARDVTHDVGTAPTYSAAGLNGMPAVDFAGGGLSSSVFSTTESGPLTVFVVAKARATNNQGIVDAKNTDPARRIAVGTVEGGWAVTRGASTRGGTVDTDPHQITAITNDVRFAVRLDGAQVSERTDAGTVADRIPTDVRLGARADGAGLLNGLVGEVFMARGELTTEQIEMAEQYLRSKWGL